MRACVISEMNLALAAGVRKVVLRIEGYVLGVEKAWRW